MAIKMIVNKIIALFKRVSNTSLSVSLLHLVHHCSSIRETERESERERERSNVALVVPVSFH